MPQTQLDPREATRFQAVLSRPGNSLLVLRAFLGATFVFAGLQKLASPGFFRANTPASFRSQLQGAIATSPLHGLLRFALHAPTLIAILIALGEIAVGLGTLCGLFSRITAIGGLLLSLSFFLAISFHDDPYYYGADIVFLFAWTPFILGEPGALSLDGLIFNKSRRQRLETGVDLGRRKLLGRKELLWASASSACSSPRSTEPSAITRQTSPWALLLHRQPLRQRQAADTRTAAGSD